MQNDIFIPRPRTGSSKSIVALIAGLAIVGAVLFVALNTNSQSLDGQAFFSKYTDEEVKAYKNFVKTYKKSYLSPEERDARLGVFVKNYRYINEQNANEENTYTLAMNSLTDMTLEEFKQNYLGLDPSLKPEDDDAEIYKPSKEQLKAGHNPLGTDHRGRLTGVKNQGGCGSCWAFSANAAVENLFIIYRGEVADFSEQELVDCSRGYGNNGCNGGWMTNAFNYIKDYSISFTRDYPYRGVDQQCQGAPKQWGLKGYVNIRENSNDDLYWASEGAIISVAVNAGSQGWQFYKGGILNNDCGTNLDHGVAVVGSGWDGQDYWLVRNSWGTGWGEGGHLRILRQGGDHEGMCGIAKAASFPTV